MVDEADQKESDVEVSLEDFDEVYSFSTQAVGALMTTLQKGLIELVDITEIIEDFNLVISEGEIYIENPPKLEKADVDVDELEEEMNKVMEEQEEKSLYTDEDL